MADSQEGTVRRDSNGDRKVSIEVNDLRAATTPGNPSAINFDSEEQSHTISSTPTATAISKNGFDINNEETWPVSRERLKKARAQRMRARGAFRLQVNHLEGHINFMLAEGDPEAFFRDIAQHNPKAAAAVRNYNFALPPHPETYIACKLAYLKADSEYLHAKNEVSVQLIALIEKQTQAKEVEFARLTKEIEDKKAENARQQAMLDDHHATVAQPASAVSDRL